MSELHQLRNSLYFSMTWRSRTFGWKEIQRNKSGIYIKIKSSALPVLNTVSFITAIKHSFSWHLALDIRALNMCANDCSPKRILVTRKRFGIPPFHFFLHCFVQPNFSSPINAVRIRSDVRYATCSCISEVISPCDITKAQLVMLFCTKSIENNRKALKNIRFPLARRLCMRFKISFSWFSLNFRI